MDMVRSPIVSSKARSTHLSSPSALAAKPAAEPRLERPSVLLYPLARNGGRLSSFARLFSGILTTIHTCQAPKYQSESRSLKITAFKHSRNSL